MEFRRTFTGSPWEPVVGYCRAVRAGGSIYVTGCAPVNPDGSVFAPGKPYEQAAKCLEIIEKALNDLGGTRQDVVRTRMFVTDISMWKEFGRAHGEFFKGCPPATSMVEVRRLIDPAMLIEIEADAVTS